MQHGDKISGAIYDLVTSYGGSISAEHGIGRIKVDELKHYRSKIELDVMRSLKRALDPDNLMNPGKVIRV
jgi:FAD/FMN-containing dehydrogenase